MKLTNHQKHILRTVYNFNYYYGDIIPMDPKTLGVCIYAAGNHDENEYLGTEELAKIMEDIKKYLTYINSSRIETDKKREKFLKENPNIS